MNQTTDPSVIKWIVCALIGFVGFTLGVQGVCILFSLTPPEGILREFTSASNMLTGMLGGLLMRTSSAQQPATSTTTQTTQTTIKTEPEPDKKP